MLTAAALLAALAWAVLLLAPPWPWRNRHLLSALPGGDHDLHDVTVLIPARDEAALLPATLRALAHQGRGLAVVVVDDQSRDGTADAARGAMAQGLTVVRGAPLPPGWSGKVWAQHQAEPLLDRPLTLLLDADVELAPGLLAALKAKLGTGDLALASVMARLRAAGAWERLLVPAFVYFFKLVYPFALSNHPATRVAAAAGGCILVRTAALRASGGFAGLKDALIDDCTLARRVKALGVATWIGQSTDVVSRRRYDTLATFWDMVARTAYTQLGYSPVMLAACTAAMLVAFTAPLAALVAGGQVAAAAGGAAFACMLASYLPAVRFQGISHAWVLALPLAAMLFLAMTWSSALRYWRGERSRWRGRRYARASGAGA